MMEKQTHRSSSFEGGRRSLRYIKQERVCEVQHAVEGRETHRY